MHLARYETGLFSSRDCRSTTKRSDCSHRDAQLADKRRMLGDISDKPYIRALGNASSPHHEDLHCHLMS